jgi:hypothetical protein
MLNALVAREVAGEKLLALLHDLLSDVEDRRTQLRIQSTFRKD